MKKFKENNPIDIIEALCQMGNTESVGIQQEGLSYNTEIYLYYIGD